MSMQQVKPMESGHVSATGRLCCRRDMDAGVKKDIWPMMEDFSKQAQDLCVDLEAKREEEMKFLENLRQKYGAGKIDIFSLSWKKEDENEHQGTN
jgi:hypothetical protein